MNLKLGQIAELIGGELVGPKDMEILRPVPAGCKDPKGITFAETKRFLEQAKRSGVGAVILSEELGPCEIPCIKVDSPRHAFFKVLTHFESDLSLEEGIHPTAVVHPTAKIDASACIGAYSVIGPEVVIGSHAKIHPYCYIGDRCLLGSYVTLYPRVTLYQDTRVGAHTILHSGAVIGGDGFGYYWDGKQHVRIPQVGHVELGEHVSVGCNACIDRATCGATQIRSGSKIDNLVQIGHNVEIGEHNIIAGLSGIAGSSKTGKNVVIAGHVAVSDHIIIGDGVRVGGRSGVIGNIEEPGDYFGLPSVPAKQALRVLALEQRLPELFERLREVEAKLARMQSEILEEIE